MLKNFKSLFATETTLPANPEIPVEENQDYQSLFGMMHNIGFYSIFMNTAANLYAQELQKDY